MINRTNVAEVRQSQTTDQRINLIDVRSASEFAEAHIPGAVNIPMEEIESRLADLPKTDPIVLICQSGTRAEMSCAMLKPHRSDLSLLEGGTDAWVAQGLPVIGNKGAGLPIMRQVQLFVGPLIVAGALLALTVNPLWAILPALIGAGLTVAGATGFCGMAKIIAKMPWNKPTKTPPPGTEKPPLSVELK